MKFVSEAVRKQLAINVVLQEPSHPVHRSLGASIMHCHTQRIHSAHRVNSHSTALAPPLSTHKLDSAPSQGNQYNHALITKKPSKQRPAKGQAHMRGADAGKRMSFLPHDVRQAIPVHRSLVEPAEPHSTCRHMVHDLTEPRSCRCTADNKALHMHPMKSLASCCSSDPAQCAHVCPCYQRLHPAPAKV